MSGDLKVAFQPPPSCSRVVLGLLAEKRVVGKAILLAAHPLSLCF